MLTVKQTVAALKERDLFKEIIVDGQWQYDVPEKIADLEFRQLSYDSRVIEPQTLFICKGQRFNPQYLVDAVKKGATACLTQQVYDEELAGQTVWQLVVTDVQKAMATVARAFYGDPEKELTLIGFTGTKGKTTSVYFTRHILAHVFDNQVAQLSSIAECLDGKNFIESHLTTPESLDLYRMMRQAVDNGMKYLMMEVSSQAYKKSRVDGLHFDIGVFLNISRDHISPVEHPSFDDYLWCKSQLVKNADKVIINREIPYFELLAQKTRAFGNQLITYGSDQSDADYRFTLGEHGHFQVASFNDQLPTVAGDFRVMLPGSFNCSNATAALAVAAQLSDKTSEFAAGLLETKVPGRMEILKNEKGYVACVDYAHNYLSMSESFKFLKHEYPDGRLIVVTGSVGSKAESRRQDIGRALSEYADVAILTEDDNYFEDPKKIIQAIRDHIVDPHVEVHEILNREEAIKTAFQMARPGDVMFMAAKGREQFLRENGHDKPYVGDYQLTEQLMKAYN